MKRITFIFICVILSCSVSFGQLKKSRLGSNSKQHVSLSGGANKPLMDIHTDFEPSCSFSYTYYFLPKLGLRGALEYNWFTGQSPVGHPNYYAHIVELSAQVVFNYYVYTGSRRENNSVSFIPERAYIFGGVGALCYLREQVNYAPAFTASFPIGTGLQFPIRDNWAWGIDFTWHFTIADDIDNYPVQKSFTDGYPTLMLTFTYKIPDQKRSGTGYGYKSSKKGLKCDPRKGCEFTFD